ncbi:hypothetical protein KR51_00037830, partial [Rubidibacter lacunae KORDI 51-2]
MCPIKRNPTLQTTSNSDILPTLML